MHTKFNKGMRKKMMKIIEIINLSNARRSTGDENHLVFHVLHSKRLDKNKEHQPPQVGYWQVEN